MYFFLYLKTFVCLAKLPISSTHKTCPSACHSHRAFSLVSHRGKVIFSLLASTLSYLQEAPRSCESTVRNKVVGNKEPLKSLEMM